MLGGQPAIMSALQDARKNRVRGTRGVAYLAGGLVAAFLLASCELVEKLTEDPPPKKAVATESETAEGQAAVAESEAPEAEPAEPVATIPPSDDLRLVLRVPFETGEAALSEESQAALTVLAGQIPGNPATTPEILAYWNAASEDPSRAKFFSLKRGMVVRSFLKEHGAVVPRIRLQPVSDLDPDLVDLISPLR
jgi:outer membrane protein OmpA-like peptidoglycan-associated protein